MFALRSESTQLAVQNIQRRAERVLDVAKLHDIYVDSGVQRELSIGTNQVIHGRRGVGKTHLLHFYRDNYLSHNHQTLFQIHDCTRLGSGIGDDGANATAVATRAFNQLLNDIASQAFDDLDRLKAVDQATKARYAGNAVLTFQEVVGKGGDSGSRFDFRNLGDTLDAYRQSAEADHLVIGLDEFVAIPRAAQPYFAEYVKRSFFTKPRIVFKIAAVTYQTKTNTHTELGDSIGFEPGADTFGDVNLDQYFVWEEDDAKAESFFGQVLYNHLANDLKWELGIQGELKRKQVIQSFFTQEKAFGELCRAAEGNCRDFLNIFRNSFFAYQKDESAERLGIAHIKKGAEDWYYSEKVRNIADEGQLDRFLNHLIQKIIRERRTKTFMVHYRDINHPVLTRLFTARLLHPLRTIWKHPDKPGEPYHLVTMDYGCYVALKNTQSAPDERLFYDPNSPGMDDLVPLDDRRSIRRVVLAREDLDQYSS